VIPNDRRADRLMGMVGRYTFSTVARNGPAGFGIIPFEAPGDGGAHPASRGGLLGAWRGMGTLFATSGTACGRPSWLPRLRAIRVFSLRRPSRSKVGGNVGSTGQQAGGVDLAHWDDGP